MLDKEFWPSPEKIERLRQTGKVAYSSQVTALIILGTLLGVTLLWLSDLKAALQIPFFIQASTLASLIVKLKVVVNFILVLSVATIVVVFLVGLLQTRFYINFSLASFNTKRLWFNRELNYFTVFIKFLFAIIVGLSFSLLVGYALIPGLLGLLKLGSTDLASFGGKNLNGFISLAVLIWLVALLVMTLLTKFLFYSKQRMTKTEANNDSPGR